MYVYNVFLVKKEIAKKRGIKKEAIHYKKKKKKSKLF